MNTRHEKLDRLKTLMTTSCKDTRNDFFKNGFPQFGFNYWDIKMDMPLVIDDKEVKKLRLLTDANNPELNMALVITWDDGQRSVKSVDNDSAKEFYSLFRQLAVPNLMFKRMGKERLDWETTSMSSIYQEDINNQGNRNPQDHYNKLHAKLKNAILHIMDNDHLAQINLIDGGCGSGILLKKLESELKNTHDIQFVGFDYNEENIEECQSNYTGKCVFIKGNLYEINNTFKELANANYINMENPSILLLSGSMTRLVFDNAFQAVTSLQQIASNNVDYILGGGVGEPLINPHIAKRIGYEVQPIPNSTYDESKFFAYHKMGLDQILQNKIKKIQSRNMLDLSFAPNPSFLLTELMKIDTENTDKNLHDGLVIDVSFCELNDALLESLTRLTEQYKDIEFIFWHWENKEVEKFIAAFSEKALIKSAFCINSEGYLMAPKAFYNALHTEKIYPYVDFSARKSIYSTNNTVFNLSAKSDFAESKRPEIATTNVKFLKLIDNIYQLKLFDNAANNAVFNYIMSELSRSEPAGMVPLSWYDRIAEHHHLFDGDHMNMNKITVKNEQAALKLEAFMSKTKQSMLKEVSQGNLEHLPELLYLCLNGILVEYRHGGYTFSFSSGQSLSDEVELYTLLANVKKDIFDPKLMLQLADAKLSIAKMDSSTDAIDELRNKDVRAARVKLSEMTKAFEMDTTPSREQKP